MPEAALPTLELVFGTIAIAFNTRRNYPLPTIGFQQFTERGGI